MFRKDFDSTEEFYFYMLLQEMYQLGMIETIIYQPGTFLLCDEVRKPKKILSEVSYTPDFKIIWNKKFLDKTYTLLGKPLEGKKRFYAQIIDKKHVSFIEIKGTGNRNNSGYLTNIRRSWLYQKHEIFVNLTKIELNKKFRGGLFSTFFCPRQLVDDYIYKTNTKHGLKGESRMKYEYDLLTQENLNLL